MSGRSQVSAGLSRAGNLSGCFEEKCKLDEVSQHPVDTKDETVAPSFHGPSSLPPSEQSSFG